MYQKKKKILCLHSPLDVNYFPRRQWDLSYYNTFTTFFTFTKMLTKGHVEERKIWKQTLCLKWGKCPKSISLSCWDNKDYCLIRDLYSKAYFLKKKMNTGGLRWSVKWLIRILMVSEKNKFTWKYVICKFNCIFLYIPVIVLIIITSLKVDSFTRIS